jgi:hypothetical protein
MASILICLETHNIRPEDPLEDLGLERQGVVEVFGWEGGVQEPADLDVDVQLLCPLSEQEWEQHEVDVVDPD